LAGGKRHWNIPIYHVDTKKERMMMEIELYQRVLINRDLPDEHLREGDVAWLVDYDPNPAGEERGAVLEVFNILGEHLRVTIVPVSAVSVLSSDLIPAARHP
jgi:hypothetical protein